MNSLDSFLFLLLVLNFLWLIKADIFFIVFGIVVLLYIITQSFFLDPLEIIFTIGQFILANPLGFLILFIPLIISGISKEIRKRIDSNRKVNWYYSRLFNFRIPRKSNITAIPNDVPILVKSIYIRPREWSNVLGMINMIIRDDKYKEITCNRIIK